MQYKFLISLIVFLCGFPLLAQSASLDDFDGAFVPPHRYLYALEFSYYHQNERGDHGSILFGHFNSEPAYFTLGNDIRFTPIENTELRLGYSNSFSPTYQRFTYDESTPVLDFLNDYRADQFHQFEIDARHRRGTYEFYLDTYGNNQRSSWHSAPGFTEGNFFTHITSHYEDIVSGVRFAEDKLGWQASLRYRSGRLQRHNDFFGTTPATTRDLTQDLRAHWTPEFKVQYEFRDDITLHSGVAYTTPYKYNFDFKQHNFNGTSNFILATYSMSKQLFFPIAAEYQIRDDLRIKFSSDLTIAKQRLDAHEKETDNSVTTYEAKKLHYYQTKPTFEVEYFYDAEKEAGESVFGSVTKNLLKQNQYRLKFKWEHDKTSLNKNAANGSQNIIDPYNVFNNPSLDNFLAGTERAAFLAGNSSSSFSNVKPQDYYVLELGFDYGIFDTLNADLRAGYHSGSAVHQYVFDRNISNRFYVFEPYYYVQWVTDWQIKEENLISLDLYFVPKYKTFLTSDLDAQQYEVENEYFQATFSFTKLF